MHSLLHQKTEEHLRKIVAQTRGVFGLFALDLNSGETFSINENEIFPQASAIKIPLVMEVFKQASEGKFQLSETRRINRQDMTPGSGVLRELGDGTVQLSLHDLCVLTILVSDNTATNLLIDLVGMEHLNRTLQSLGLKQTRLQRRMMDMAAAQRGEENLSTPAEAARVMQLLYRGEFVSRKACDDILDMLTKPKSGKIIAGLPPTVSLASKPGGIAGVTTEWAIISLPNRPYVLTVMENYGTEPDATNAIKEISQVLYHYFLRLSRSTSHGAYVSTP